MQDNKKTDLLSERLFHIILDAVSHYRYVILGSFLIGLLSYVYVFTNSLPNHDCLAWFFQKGASIESGRFVLVLLSYIFPDYSMPWIYGILGLFFFTLGNCLIIRIFGIRNHVLQFLLSGIIISFPSLIGTFTYTFTACPYAVCYYLSVLAAYYMTTGKRKYILPAVLALVGTLGIYQAYLSITVSILILFLIYQLILDQVDAKALFFRGIQFVIFLLISLIIYWSISSLLWKYGETEIGGYASNALSFQPSSILSGIKNAYIGCIQVLRYRHHGLISSPLSHCIHFGLFIFAGAELLCYILRSKSISKSLLLLFLLIMLPLGINCIYIFVSMDSIHTLVLLSYISLYILFAFLIEYGQIQMFSHRLLHVLHAVTLDAAVAFMAVIIAGNVYLANEAYLNMQLAYENTYAFATSIVTQLQSMPEYTQDAKVTIIGEYDSPDYYQYFSDAAQITGAAGISPDTYSIEFFYEYYVGFPLNLVPQDLCIKDLNEDELAQMPSYPNHGYLAQNNDIFVIKLSEPVS